MKVLVCGSRDWADREAIEKRLGLLPKDTTIISGAARGADAMAVAIGRKLGLEAEMFPADWERFGKSAGFKRNLLMLDQQPQLVIAFHLNGSRGTAHTIEKARKRGIPVEVIGK